MKDTDIRAIVGDQGAAEQYSVAERKTGFVAPIYSEPQSSQDKSVNLADSGPKMWHKIASRSAAHRGAG